ncbi:MAG TPA: SigE family RNA polymerase sigma factor [Jiangellales bacterium]|nr:SigE family RNA polymerase sigma factor [Jiangellales bacterium]
MARSRVFQDETAGSGATRGWQVGDSDDFDAFYHATNRALLRQMYAMTGNLADAQDSVQEAYARAWQHWGTVRDAENPTAWVRTVAWRISASRWRKAKGGVRALVRHGPPEHGAEPSPDNVALVAALRQIPEAQRRAVVLHHLGGLSVEEVARETGAPTGTVKARLSRGRAALAELLRDEPREEGHRVR